MYTVYVLRSQKDLKRYIGMSSNLENRLRDHEKGLVRSTRNRRHFELIYTEEFKEKRDAELREKFFKSGQGRAYLKSIGK